MRCKWPQPTVADMKTTCIVAVGDASTRGNVYPPAPRGLQHGSRSWLSVGQQHSFFLFFASGAYLPLTSGHRLSAETLGKINTFLKNTQSAAVISAPLNNNTHEIHNAASMCRDGSGKWPPPPNTGRVWIKRFAWTQWCVLPGAHTSSPSIRAAQNALPFLSDSTFNRAALSDDL